MNEKAIETESDEILTKAIAQPDNVEEVLKRAREELEADDARFRLRSWDDRSVVPVPGWIVSTPEESETDIKRRENKPNAGKTHFRLEQAQPELAERVYYDTENPLRVDCIVGLKSRIARLAEEEMKEDKDTTLIQDLKSNIEEIEGGKIQFIKDERKKYKAFNDFLTQLKKTAEEFEEKKAKWEVYYDYVVSIKEKPNFFDLAFDQNHAPWMKGEMEMNKKKVQWELLRKYLEEHREGDEIGKFISDVKNTLERYTCLYEDYNRYIPEAECPSNEIVIPVVAFGKFIGILNFHKEQGFSPGEETVARKYSFLLATVYLQWQSELLEKFQEISQTVIAENNFEIIASKITASIREGLKYGLDKEDVYPVLYVPKQQLRHPYKMDNEEMFDWTWRDSYQRRHKPKKLQDQQKTKEAKENEKEWEMWNQEQKLGPIPIRINGLGSNVIEKWNKRITDNKPVRAQDRFTACTDVDNADSTCGSRSAFHHEIKTTGCLLLTFEGEIYGLLYLHCRKRHFFTETELRALNAFGTQAAVAIKNAKLIGSSYEELFGSRLLDVLERGEKR